jgi:hypothetical protein
MASETMCAGCGHDHKSEWPEGYPYPDKVCPKTPQECDCYSFVRPVPTPPVQPEADLMCRRCGTLLSHTRGFHQAECRSGWVEVPAPTQEANDGK